MLEGQAAERIGLHDKPPVFGIEEKPAEIPGLTEQLPLKRLVTTLQPVSEEPTLIANNEDTASLQGFGVQEKTFRYCDMHVELDNGTYDEDDIACR
jgi:hypothetical protein